MLESIVRPFVRPNSLSTQRIVASREKVEVEPAIISWGTAGSLASAHQIEAIPEDPGVSFTVLMCDDEYTEKSRQVDVMRIEQTLPDGTKNPENYIDLERPYKVFFEKKELASQQRGVTQTFTTRFENTQFSTTNSSNQKCQSKFSLNRNLS